MDETQIKTLLGELTEITINKIVIAVALENLGTQVFIKRPSDYIQQFIDLRKTYDIINTDSRD